MLDVGRMGTNSHTTAGGHVRGRVLYLLEQIVRGTVWGKERLVLFNVVRESIGLEARQQHPVRE